MLAAKSSVLCIAAAILLGGCATTKPSLPSFQHSQPSVLKEKPKTNTQNDVVMSYADTQMSIKFFDELNAYAVKKAASTQNERIQALHSFFNSKFSYKPDIDNYGEIEHWASLTEMMQHSFSGDCEDFTFGKIQVAAKFGLEKEDLWIGFTEKGGHLFPMFFTGEEFVVSDSTGGVVDIEKYAEMFSDLKVFRFDEIWDTKEIVFSANKRDGFLDKVAKRPEN